MNSINWQSPAIPVTNNVVGYEKALQAVLRSVYKGNCCRILGPRHHQKSQIMQRVAELLDRQQTHTAVYIKLVEIQREDEETFFSALWDQICKTLPSAAVIDVHHASAAGFQRALLELSRDSTRNLTLLLDNLEIVPPNLAAALLGVLRAVFSTVSNEQGARFQAIVCGSLHLNQLALDNASRFDSISDLVLITELDEQARVDWVKQRCRTAGLHPTPTGLAALLAQTGGDPLLLELITDTYVRQLRAAGQTKLTPKRVAEAITIFLQRPVAWQISEALHQIESNPSLLSCALLLLEQGEAPALALPINVEETPTVLDLCGAFRAVGHNYQIRSRLWQTLLRKHLTPARVGTLYAIAGDWPRAIQHFGEAIRTGHADIKPALFPAIINAIHGSETLPQALWQLGRGLAAAYPAADAQFFFRIHDTLQQIYPLSSPGSHHTLPLDEQHWPEAEALDGPEYSIMQTALGTRIFFPMRLTPNAAAVGLFSFSRLTATEMPYLQWEERLQLVNFLRQAARALESKEQFVEMLDTSNRRAEKLNTLNQILTALLRQRDQPAGSLLQIVLAGLTNGWGLEFNRAILFVPDPSRQFLMVDRAVGHLTNEEAEAEWAQEPYHHQSVEQWLATLFSAQDARNPYHQRLQCALTDLTLSLTNGHDPLIQCFTTHQPLRSENYTYSIHFAPELYHILQPPKDFALVPLRAGEQTTGVIYVDNKFTRRRVSAEYFELLQTFVNQAALIIENARAFALEKAQTAALTKLLALEENVNGQITHSIKAVLEAIVTAAKALVDADCTIIYPLQSTDLSREPYVYDVDNIIGVNILSQLGSPPRRSGGHAAWVIQAGILPISDVSATALPVTGAALLASRFIREEGIQSFVGVRLGSAEAPVAVLYLNWRTLRHFSEEELQLIRVFANFAAVALPSARRYQQVRTELDRRTQELDQLREDLRAGLAVDDSTEREGAFAWALQRAQERTGAAYVYLIRREPYDKQRFLQLTHTGEVGNLQASRRKTELAHKSVMPNMVILHRHHQAADATLFQHLDTRTALQMEIEVSGNSLATLHLETAADDAFPVEQQDYLRHIANRLALTLEQIERTQALRALVEIALKLTNTKDLTTMLTAIVDQAMQAMRTVSAITLYYLDEATDQLILGYAAGVKDEDGMAHRPPYTHTRLDAIWQLDEPIYAVDVADNPLLLGPFVQREAIRSVAAFPLQVKQTRVGCLFFNYRTRHFFDEGERSLLVLFAQLTAVAIHQARLDRIVQYARERELWHRIGDLSTGLIHDVNSTLANVLDLVSEIERKLRAGKDVTAPLADLQRLAGKTEDISARLYEHAYRKELRPTAVGLNSLIQQAIQELAHQKPPHVTMVYHTNERLPVVQVDRLLMIQLLRNLITNAWEAIPGDRPGVVTIDACMDQQHLRILVHDNGKGVAPENLERVFEPNFTTNTTQPGLHGFGLYYCRQIAREHQGDLLVQSRPDQGTTFTVLLPSRLFYVLTSDGLLPL